MGSDDIPAEAWKCLGATGTDILTDMFNKIIQTEKMPDEWRRVLEMTVGRRWRDRPKRRWKDSITEDIVALGLVEEDAQGRVIWRQHIRTGDPT